jgi:hypothetical protein
MDNDLVLARKLLKTLSGVSNHFGADFKDVQCIID